MPTLQNEFISVVLDDHYPRIVSLTRIDSGATLLCCDPSLPFTISLNDQCYTDPEVSHTANQDEITYRLAILELAFSIDFRLHLEREVVIVTVPRVEEHGSFQLERFYIPDHRLISGTAARGDSYVRIGTRRVNWSREWTPGAGFDSWEDMGRVRDGIPELGATRINYACVWNTGICAVLHSSAYMEPLIANLTDQGQVVRGRAGRFSVWSASYPYRLRGTLAKPFELRLAVLGDYNGDGKVDWCDAAAWQGDQLVPTDNYGEQIIYKLFLDRPTAAEPNRTFAQCLDVIKTIHKVSGGIKQIAYLVGWQQGGHDSGYPEPHEINERLGGSAALHALIHDAKQYNAVVSIHHNFDDAYVGNPSYRDDLLGKEPDGTPHLWFRSYWFEDLYNGKPVYSINHTLSVESGFARERIDRLLTLIPLSESIHLDAHRPYNETWFPDGDYIDSECEMQRGILPIKVMLAERGIDVTTEGHHLGVFNWGWMNGWLSHYYTVMTHGRVRGYHRDRAEGQALGKHFVVDEFNPGDYMTITRDFYTHWMYAEILARKKMTSYHIGDWNEGVIAHYKDNTRVRSGRGGMFPIKLEAWYEGIRIADGDDRFLPWRDDTIFSFSPTGGQKEWLLPKHWQESTITATVIDETGKTPLSTEVRGNCIQFEAPAGKAVKLVKGSAERTNTL
jgi:hypothetical protein